MQPSRLDELLRVERTVAPEPGADERIWAAIEHRLTSGPPPPAGAEAAPGALGGAAALKVAAGLALVAAAAGALMVGGAGRKEHVREDMPAVAAAAAAPRSEPAVAPEPASPPVVAAPVAAAPVREAPIEAPAVEAPVEAPAKPSVERRPKQRRATSPSEVEPAEAPPVERSADDFAAELQLVAEIRRAVGRGEHGLALAKVDEHARRFGARGQLVQERLAYQVEALCAAGRVADARRVAGELLAKWPDSTHAPRVRSSCAGA